MTKQNLLDLADRSEAGEIVANAAYIALGKPPTMLGPILEAFDGSIEAARALHDHIHNESSFVAWVVFLIEILEANPNVQEEEVPRYCVAKILRAKAGEE